MIYKCENSFKWPEWDHPTNKTNGTTPEQFNSLAIRIT